MPDHHPDPAVQAAIERGERHLGLPLSGEDDPILAAAKELPNALAAKSRAEARAEAAEGKVERAHRALRAFWCNRYPARDEGMSAVNHALAILTEQEQEPTTEGNTMNVEVEIARDPGTRRALHLRLRYGPYNTEVPGVDEQRVYERAREQAEQDIVEAGLKDFRVFTVRRIESPRPKSEPTTEGETNESNPDR